MRHLLSGILALALLLPLPAQAYDLLVLMGRQDPAYSEVLKGFQSRTKLSSRTVVLADYDEVDVARIVREDRPRLVLALGDRALEASRVLRQTPVISAMALGLHRAHGSQPNLTGIGMFVAPEHYIPLFKPLKAKRVGIVHDPSRSGWYVRQARAAAEKAGVELVVREVSSPRDTLGKLASLSGKVDAVWMLPDTTAVTRETAEAYFRFGQEQAVPVVSFAGAYLGLGAAAALDIDRTELGVQAGDMAATILNSGGNSLPIGTPGSCKVKVNRTVLNRLRLAPEPVEQLTCVAR